MASAQERIWLAEYLKCFNATSAARKAGYKWPNKIGPRKKQKFAGEIEAALEEKALSAEQALSMLADIATFDVSPYVVQRGNTAVYIDAERMKADGYGHLIRSAYTTRDGARVEIADVDWAKKVILDHVTKGPSGREDDPIHTVTYIQENRPDGDDDAS